MKKIRKRLLRKYITIRWKNGITLKDLCEAIRPFTYAFVKVDVPYMPCDFPKHVPIGKDADILCLRRDFPAVKREVTAWAGQYEKQFAVRTIDEPNGFRLRLEYHGNLVYQADIRWKYADNFPEEFTEEALSNRIERNGYYVLNTPYELLIRTAAYRADPGKKYHLAYITEHQSENDEQLERKWVGDSRETVTGSQR